MSSINVGSVRVDVVPDASRFNERLKADLSRLPSAVIKVDADVAAAAARIDELTRGRILTVNVDADTAGAAAHIDELTRRRDAKVNVDVDTGGAEAKLAAVGASANSAGGGMSGLLTAGLALGPAIIPVAAAAGAAILGIGSAALSAGPALGALFLGFSGVSDAVSALGKADSTSAASGAAAAAARVAQANAIANAQSSLANAERTAAASAISSAQAVIDAERGVADAKRSAAAGIAAAILSEADAQRSADRGVAAAVLAASDAHRSAAQGVATAVQSQMGAEQALVTAQDSARTAQLALTQARVAAKQSIEDLTNSVADGVLAQRQANLNVEQTRSALGNLGPSSAQYAASVSATAVAHARLDAVMRNSKSALVARLSAQQALTAAEQKQQVLAAQSGGTILQREQAQLAYDQALQQVTDLATRQGRLAAQKAVADKAGVAGAANVVAAQAGVAKSVTGVANAQTALGRAEAAVVEARRAGAEKVSRAEAAVVEARRAGAESVARAVAVEVEARRSGAERVAIAQESVTKALRAQANSAASSAASVASAQRQVQQAMAKTSTAGTAAGTALQQAMDKLSPAGRDFAKFIYSLKPELDRLKATSQGALLPGVTTFFKELTPLMPVFNRIIGAAAGALGDLFAAAGKALQAPFWRDFFNFLASTVGPNIRIFGQILGDLATGFAGLLMAFAPVGDTVMGVIAGLAKSFADWAKNLSGSSGFKAFMAYLAENGPKVWGLLKDLLKVSADLIIGLAPLGSVILDVLGRLAAQLAKMSPTQITAVAIAIGAIAAALSGQWIALAIIAIGGVVTGFTDWYNHSKTLHDWVQNKLLPALKGLWQWIQDTLVPILQGVLKQAWEGIQTAVKNVTQAFKDNKGELKQLGDGFKVYVDFLVTKVMPIIGPVLKAAFTGIGQSISSVITLVGKLVDAFNWWKTVTGTVLKAVVGSFLVMAGGILHAADRAFGWIPGIGPQLHAAAVKFDSFAAGVNAAIAGITKNPKITVTAKLATSVLGQLPNGQNYWAPGVSIGPRPKGLFNGGPIIGMGTGTSDDVPFMGSNGEHVLTAQEVAAAGGHAAIFAYRKQLRGYAAGGPIISTSLANPAVLKQSYDARIVAAYIANLGTIMKSSMAAAGAAGGGGVGGGSIANLIAFGRMLQGLQYQVSEHPAFGGVTPGAHARNSLHYVGRAIDVNHDQGSEPAYLDRAVAMSSNWGLHHLWRVAGHFNHAHFDTGPGGGGGGLGGLLAGFSGGGTSGANQALGLRMMLAAGWGANQWGPLKALWNRESGWNSNARNSSSGAAGIPQDITGNMHGGAAGQIAWGLNYIRSRYGSPAAAYEHSNRVNWYANGTDYAAPGYAWVGDRGKELVNFRGGETVTPIDKLGGGFDYDKLAQAMTRVQIGLDGRGVAASVDHRLGAGIR